MSVLTIVILSFVGIGGLIIFVKIKRYIKNKIDLEVNKKLNDYKELKNKEVEKLKSKIEELQKTRRVVNKKKVEELKKTPIINSNTFSIGVDIEEGAE